ncbi:hypothetical protein CLOSTHATH_03984 [Hungatella hathewayi DSM 13479]|uniref:Uncharacterized protein n=1 Tax=Hungatella hathewayi DSM 13479 TaxID=566550 RepID=D3AK41_9FIRM|nr:hypothetical protein CLOSTHATH_03984 [Hungatella hathewayi DSM 13479]
MGKSCHGVPADWLGTDGMYPFACYAAHQRPLSLSKNNRLCRPAKAHQQRICFCGTTNSP